MRDMKKNNYTLALVGLYAGYFLTAIAPVLSVVVIKWKDYVSTPSRAVSLASGGIIALALLLMQIAGKTTRNVHRIVKFGVLTLACWSLNALIDELCLLVSCAFGGELLSWAIFTIPIEKIKEKRLDGSVKKLIEDSVLSGRV